MSIRARLSAWTRAQKVALGMALAVAVYAVLGFVALPALARNIALEQLQLTFSRAATVGDVRINPFLLTVDVERFVLPDRDGSPFVSFSSLHANFELVSIFNQAFTFRELRLAEPVVHVKILEDGGLNFGDILEILLEEDETAPSEDAGVPPVLVGLASIEAGRIAFSDFSRPTVFEHEISPLDIEVRDFGTRPDDESPYSFKATTGAGEALEWEGSISAVPFYSKGRLALTGVRPRTGWLYVQDDVFFEVVDGMIDIEARYDLDGRDELTLKLDEGVIRVRDFAVADRETGENAMSIASLDVEGITVAYPEQELRITSLRSRGGVHHALRLENGELRVSQLLESRGAETAPLTPSVAEPEPEPDAAAPPWSVIVDEIDVAEHRIDFEDRSTSPPVMMPITPISLRLTDVHADLTHAFQLRLEVAIEEGRAIIEGPVQVEPLSIDLAVEVEQLDLRVFEPYWLPMVDVDMASGHFGADGGLGMSLAPAGEPAITWAGDLRLDSLRLLDRSLHANLVSWSALELSALKFDSATSAVLLDRLRLVKPAVHFVIAPDGQSNFSQLAVAEPEAAVSSDTGASSPAPSISLGRVEIVKGAATFEDRSVAPRFDAGVTQLDGAIGGISSNREARARVDFTGLLNGATPMKVDGEMSPLAEKTYIDLRLAFDNLELSPLTPYSGHHIGQAIDRGKLFLDVEYILDGTAIRGENRVMLDQFTLGDRVESEDATNLPVGLAIALLKDRNGEIHIDLPVKGDVDDPEFGFGKMLFGALGTLITKVALSPFAMLGGLGGGGEEARSVVFERGRAGIAVAEVSKLDALANALGERPGLVLEVAGGASAELDRPVLQADALEIALRRARLKELQGRWFGDKPETIDDIDLEAKHRRRLLEARYQAVFGQKPKAGQVPLVEGVADPAALEAAWLAEIERMLAAEIEIDEAALRQLARRRSEAVRDYLVQQGGVSAERVYVLDVSIGRLEGGPEPDATLTLGAG